MTRTPPGAPSDKDAPLDPAIASIVLRLNDAISAFRADERSGLRALDSVSGLMRKLTDEEVLIEAERRAERGCVPRRPDRVELAIFTALADTYGEDILTNSSLGYALRFVGQHGGVALVQRVLWGESVSDVQLAVMFDAACAAFTQIAFAFSDDLLAQANDVLAGFRLPPPGGPKSVQSDRG